MRRCTDIDAYVFRQSTSNYDGHIIELRIAIQLTFLITLVSFSLLLYPLTVFKSILNIIDN